MVFAKGCVQHLVACCVDTAIAARGQRDVRKQQLRPIGCILGCAICALQSHHNQKAKCLRLGSVPAQATTVGAHA